jgi:hypothetical protein
MASIWWEEPVAARADLAWAALRHVGMAHQLFSPVLVDSSVEGDIRTVTFANGLVVREWIIAIDEQRRRIAYSVLGDTFDHHSASMQILPIDRVSCRFLWVIPSPIDQNPCAQSRRPMDMTRQGWSMSLFHAAQQ